MHRLDDAFLQALCHYYSTSSQQWVMQVYLIVTIIGYTTTTTTTTTLDICVIASRAAPAIGAATVTILLVCPLHLPTFTVALNSAQSHYLGLLY